MQQFHSFDMPAGSSTLRSSDCSAHVHRLLSLKTHPSLQPECIQVYKKQGYLCSVSALIVPPSRGWSHKKGAPFLSVRGFCPVPLPPSYHFTSSHLTELAFSVKHHSRDLTHHVRISHSQTCLHHQGKSFVLCWFHGSEVLN